MTTRLAESKPGAVRKVLAVRYPQAVHEEGEPTEREKLPGLPRTLSRNFNPSIFPSVLGREVEGCRGGEEKGLAAFELERHAAYLAERFDDWKSLAWYRLVVRIVPHELLWDAFARTLDLSPRAVRRSRAALFTSIVRGYMDGTRKPRRRRPPDPTPCPALV